MFRRLWVAGVAAGLFAGVASAADLPVASGAYYPATAGRVSYYDWMGPYIGVNAGGSFAELTATTNDVPTGTLIATTSTGNWGIAGGGQIGFNWFSVPNFVLGIEGDFDALTNKLSIGTADGAATVSKLKFISTVRGRFGLTADRFMWYATGGFAWGQDQTIRTQVTGTVNNAGPGTVESTTTTRIGWVAGTGIEYAFAAHWIARFEYLFVQLDKTSVTFPVAQRLIAASYEDNQVRLGLSYKFGRSSRDE